MVISRSKITGGSKPPPYGGELGDFAEQNHWREQAPPYGGELGDFAEQNHKGL